MSRSLSSRMVAGALALCLGALPGVAAGPARAQQPPTLHNVIPGSEMVMLQARIKTIDPQTRAITLQSPDGQTVNLVAGPLVRLNLLKEGDMVTAQYYRSVAFIIQGPKQSNAAPAPADSFRAVLARPAEAPGGIAVTVKQISGTVIGLNPAAHTLEVVDPSGGPVYRIDVTDPERQNILKMLKIGDTVTAVISEQLAVSITPAK
ncbi:hypothetical protein [Acidocella sp.]|uniref:hypothetical protein n=1 Tax=Acidocella sp. TaxID=50710 RepID=UPI00262C47B3|nr:hypothetical protein [Acidocella sp.]